MNKDVALKIGLWAIPTLFGMGALYQTVLGSSADVVEVQSELDSHEALESHPVGGAKMEIILTEQRTIRDEQKIQGQNLAAICSATGASCK